MHKCKWSPLYILSLTNEQTFTLHYIQLWQCMPDIQLALKTIFCDGIMWAWVYQIVSRYNRVHNIYGCCILCWWDIAYMIYIYLPLGLWFHIKLSHPYTKSNCGDKTIVRSTYLHNGVSNIGIGSIYTTLGGNMVSQKTAMLRWFIILLISESNTVLWSLPPGFCFYFCTYQMNLYKYFVLPYSTDLILTFYKRKVQ